MKILLIRHTSLNIAKGICYGQSDVDVSDQFVKEASNVQAQLAHHDFDAAYTSPLMRCTKLASFCGYPNAIHDPNLMELNFGDWEMKYWDDITDPNLNVWYEDWINVSATNGESFMDQYYRYTKFMNALITKKHQSVAIFTHGGILHCARIYADIDTFQNTFDNRPDYGEILEIEV